MTQHTPNITPDFNPAGFLLSLAEDQLAAAMQGVSALVVLGVDRKDAITAVGNLLGSVKLAPEATHPLYEVTDRVFASDINTPRDPYADLLDPTGAKVPEGYESILGYIARRLRDAGMDEEQTPWTPGWPPFSLRHGVRADPIKATRIIGVHLSNRAANRGIEIIKGLAPRVLWQAGFPTVNYYPTEEIAAAIDRCDF